MSCIPIHIDDETIDVSKLVMNLKYKNEKSNIEYVTSEHFQIWDMNIKNYLPKEKTQEIFPPNKITKYYIDLLRLRPSFMQNSEIKSNGEEIELECKLSRNTARTNAMFNVVSKAAFGNTMISKEELLVKFNEYKKQMTSKEDFSTDELDILEADWFNLNAKKYYISHSFDFKVESVGVFSNESIVKKSCMILINKFKNFLIGEENTYMVTKNDTFAENAYDIILKNEDYTVGKILEHLFFNNLLEEKKYLILCKFYQRTSS